MSGQEHNSRYSRQTLFAPIGREGQIRLGGSRVAIVGMGALGTVLANHMVRAGVGYVRLIDRDFVEMSNLQRQMLYDEADAAASKPKAAAAAERLRRINANVVVEPHVVDLNVTNAEQLLGGVDLILDGSDNFAVRFLVNDVSVKLGIPWIYGGAVSSRGVALAVVPGETPCLRCLFGQPPAQGTTETCDTAGVIGMIVHVVASYQATEALKLLVGDRANLNRRMLHFELWHNHQAAVDVSKARKADCPACALRRFDYLEAGGDAESIQSLCGRDAVQIQPLRSAHIDLRDKELALSPLGQVERNAFLLKFRPGGGLTLVLFPDGRAIVQGTNDMAVAKSLYSRYVGM
ncbi:MAG: ThiF family adenylyltransferase [Paenibacillaceae bacterium]|nr:ThiF family adenylyltransferase [Paenibacillaceae bacterium]